MSNKSINNDQLDQDLAQYATVSRTALKSSVASRAGKILGYTAAATSALAFAATADAAIIHVDLGAGSNADRDIDGDGVKDILSMKIVSGIGSGFPGASTGAFASAKAQFGTASVVRVGGGAQLIKNVASGALISTDPGLAGGIGWLQSTGGTFTFRSRYIYMSSTNSIGFGSQGGDWGANASTTGIVGMFTSGSKYAWLRIKITNDVTQDVNGAPYGLPNGITLLEYAFEDAAAIPCIIAGETSVSASCAVSPVTAVPLPGSLSLMAMGIGGLAAFRRRRKDNK